MNSKAEDLLATALSLPESERAEIAAQLIASLDPTVDEKASKAWDEEIARRIEELDSGKVKCLPWPEVRRMLLLMAAVNLGTGARGLLTD
jgi:putative addiction module component (TIGR02574 family)